MAFTVYIEDERGAREGEPWHHPASAPLLTGDHPGTCCLRFLDPYGDTVFNQLQQPEILTELRALETRLDDAESRLALRGLLAFLAPVTGAIHSYVRFVGD